jgi:3-oxoacyl-[acyl-carrier-protein] synthase III
VTHAGIVGLGLWLPETVRRNDEWPASFVASFRENQARRAKDFTNIETTLRDRPYDHLYQVHAGPHEDDPFKGARERRVGAYDVPTAEGDARAARRALEDAAVDPRDVDLILSSALVPDRLVPSNGPAIQTMLGATRAAGIGAESVCSSALSQLDLATALVESGRARFVLCVQSHQIGRINDMALPYSPLFGDASGAFVVGPVADDVGLVEMVRGGDGSLAGAVTHEYRDTPGAAWWRDAAGPVHPGSEDLEAGRFLSRHLLAFAIDTIGALCEKASFQVQDAAVIATLQPTVWYQAAVAAGLGVDARRLPTTHHALAHVGAAGIVANLLEARRQGLLRRRAPVILFSHGAGVTRYAALLRWHAPSAES